jgi:3-methylcrotonyl-CoA carboxylase alpha subunit
MFSSVLIANRGEIACRIIRTASRLGLRAIAVYSEADAGALHVREADEAYLIGPPPARESYLDIGRVIDAAVKSGAECIHPGYGFLSENPDFAEACRKAGIAFVGPSPESIRAMGHKDAAKKLMEKAGVPVVPGYHGKNQSEQALASAAAETGYPVMIKAVAGGGGKGMRRVDTKAQFADALSGCRREARAAFGDDRVLIEKFIADPRHIEVQIIADMFGRCIHLYERDCSLQRRHQKVIEEAPAPRLPAALREKMCEAAVAAAKAVGYVSAGTVEFIAGTREGEAVTFHFMEMNTRLQVEHPVTEMILGLDLVELQLRIAAGEPLPLAQGDIKPKGHAIEARLYAENPAAGFLPQTGKLHVLEWPRAQKGLRIDTGVEQGTEITSYYDPMIAKLIVCAPSRTAAIAALRRALDGTVILGLNSNLEFLSRIAAHPRFKEGGLTTGFIDAHLDDLAGEVLAPDSLALAAKAWAEHLRAQNPAGEGLPQARGWSLVGLPRKDLHSVIINGQSILLEVTYAPDGERVVAKFKNGKSVEADRGSAPRSHFDRDSRTLFVAIGEGQATVRAEDVLARTAEADEGAAVIHAPMPGKVIAVLVEIGQSVTLGQPLLILDAMKMEHTLKAGLNGAVKRVAVAPGSQVREGDVLCVLEKISP